MADVKLKSPLGSTPLSVLLTGARFEVIPAAGIEDRVGSLPIGTTITVTSSPRHGIGRTVEVAEKLAAAGYDVVPHLAARLVEGPEHLERIVATLRAAGVREAFIVGGDSPLPAGPYSAAGDLLDALEDMGRPFSRIGIGGYPEGHPLASAEELLAALQRKQGAADYIVTQICFDADALVKWMVMLREQGINLPIVFGLPGVVDRRKLLEISLQAGVGVSLRYLTRHGRQVAALLRAREYDPTDLARSVSERLAEAHLSVAGVHLFTFNRVAATQEWLRRVAAE
jgi:methylenetetrahydrofolate reductase (NADPH)